MWDDEAGAFCPHALDVLSFRDGQIAAVDAFLDPGVFPVFGLPSALAP
jgi:ketosteroid isomerase-like protein